jgi:hypothetical protein
MVLDDDHPSDGGQPTISVDDLQYIIHHVFFPPKLPQKDDSAPEYDKALTKQVLQALRAFEASGGQLQANTSTTLLIRMLENMLESRGSKSGLLQNAVENQMGSMKNTGMSQALAPPLHHLTHRDRHNRLPRHSPKRSSLDPP